MSSYPQFAALPVAAIPREIPAAPALGLPATVEDLPGGGALVTIGAIKAPYANARMARDWLAAQERRGFVRILQPLASPC